jgi:hypothetical protein
MLMLVTDDQVRFRSREFPWTCIVLFGPFAGIALALTAYGMQWQLVLLVWGALAPLALMVGWNAFYEGTLAPQDRAVCTALLCRRRLHLEDLQHIERRTRGRDVSYDFRFTNGFTYTTTGEVRQRLAERLCDSHARVRTSGFPSAEDERAV